MTMFHCFSGLPVVVVVTVSRLIVVGRIVGNLVVTADSLGANHLTKLSRVGPDLKLAWNTLGQNLRG
jgi:hypothetical protein